MDKKSTPNTGKEKQVVKPTFKSAALRNPLDVRKQKIQETPKEETLRDDAYARAIEANHLGKYVYPYIPISTHWVIPIKEKYVHLKLQEVASFYLKDFANPVVYHKNFQYYQDISSYTGSVEFGTIERSGGEFAFSKATIKSIPRPEQWEGNLFKCYEATKQVRSHNINLKFNDFDYINAWTHGLYYENRQRKLSW